MPDWAKHAYHNCPTVNRVMKECALRETTREEMQWRVAGALYEQRNQWKETALHLKQYEPLVVKMPNVPAQRPAGRSDQDSQQVTKEQNANA